MSTAAGLSEDARRYYAGGCRSTQDGVPVRLARRRSRELTAQRAMILLAAEAGAELELPDAPRFRFEPANPGRPVDPKGSRPAPPPPADEVKRSYYAGGHRAVIDGVPCRLPRAPGRLTNFKTGATWAPLHRPMRGWEDRVREFAKELEARRDGELPPPALAAAPAPAAAPIPGPSLTRAARAHINQRRRD